eukprot:748310-Hanusia_phi.AAC.3
MSKKFILQRSNKPLSATSIAYSLCTITFKTPIIHMTRAKATAIVHRNYHTNSSQDQSIESMDTSTNISQMQN